MNKDVIDDTTLFKQKLTEYKQQIDSDISRYSKAVRMSTLQQYGANARLEIDAFLDILARGGKRIRGALVMVGYEMCGGTDDRMILEVARAIEMIHAYILIIDDIQDRSATRRGGLTAHKLLAEYHRQNELADDAEHFGVSLALNASIAGAHAAQMTLAELDAPADIRLKVISIVNSTMLTTAHGQTNDIMNEVVAEVDIDNVERVLEWKTAHYSFLNPLHVGMVLAGATQSDLDEVHDYCMHTGKAFQITDDILGVFGSEFESGKSPMDDIREGKRTVLSTYALTHADRADKNFLIQMLGNQSITPSEFARCKAIFEECGALAYARDAAANHVRSALISLRTKSEHFDSLSIQFLRGLAEYILVRNK